MTREDLERALGEADLPGEAAARERARRTVAAAQREARPRRRRRRPFVWIAIGATAAATVLAHGPARAYETLRDAVTQPAPKPAPPPSTSALPASGRMLVTEGSSLWIVERSGKRRRLGAWRDATWSPRGLYVAATGGRTLAAIEPAGGALRWTLRSDAPVALPRWSPGGRHIAYRSGGTLRIVYGNGLHDVRAGSHMAAVAPAWRPNADHTVAWTATDGTVTVEDADTAKVIWTWKARGVRRLAWSADGARLLIAGPRRYAVHDLATNRHETARGTAELAAAAFAPQGSRLATALYAGGRTAVRVDRATVLSGPGRVRDLEWSPDGRWLLAGWPGADHWLAIRTSGRARESAVTAVRHRFGSAARIRGWCC